MTFANKFFLLKNETYKFIYNFKLYTKLNAYNFDTFKYSIVIKAEQMISNFSYSITSSSTGKIDCCRYIDNSDGYIILYIDKCQMNILK